MLTFSFHEKFVVGKLGVWGVGWGEGGVKVNIVLCFFVSKDFCVPCFNLFFVLFVFGMHMTLR